eukprot:4198539-Amphidinium_carterae.1
MPITPANRELLGGAASSVVEPCCQNRMHQAAHPPHAQEKKKSECNAWTILQYARRGIQQQGFKSGQKLENNCLRRISNVQHKCIQNQATKFHALAEL